MSLLKPLMSNYPSGQPDVADPSGLRDIMPMPQGTNPDARSNPIQGSLPQQTPNMFAQSDQPPTTMQIPGSLTDLPLFGSLPSPLKPPITNPRLEREQFLDQDAWGREHPDPARPGFWHKMGHIAARVGNVLGDIAAPSTMALIPGTDLNNRIVASNEERQAAGLRAQDTAERDAFSRRSLEGAQTAALEQKSAEEPALNESEIQLRNAQIANLLHPQAKTDFEAWQQQNPGKSVDEWLKLQAQNKPESGAQDDQKYEGIVTKSLQGQPVTSEEKAFAKAYRDRKTLGQQVTNVYANEREAGKQDVATRQAAFKAYSPAMDSAERFAVMAKNYEDAVSNHDQQAMLSLLANHLGMTMGLQKGARITRDLYKEAESSRPWLQGATAKFDKDGYLYGVTLTQPQMQQMMGLARGRYSEDVKKARSEAQYMGANDDGPARTPNQSVVNMYVGMAAGDISRAKQLMTDDGWTVEKGKK
jgi:hypothetical protein